MVANRIPTLPQQCASTYFPQFTMVKRKHIDVANRIPLQLTGAGGGGVAFTIVTPDTPEEQVIINFCFLVMLWFICLFTRSYAALRAADLDWIVGPGYSLGRVHSGEKP